MNNLYKNIGRRKFLNLLLSGLATFMFVFKSEIQAESEKKVFLTEDIIKEIKNYNLQRENKLILNYQDEIKRDLREGKTVWVKNDLLTYAQLKDYIFIKI